MSNGVLTDVAMSYVKQAAPGVDDPTSLEAIRGTFTDYIVGNITRDEAATILSKYLDTMEPLEKIEAILTVPEQPPPQVRSEYFPQALHTMRKKTRSWSSSEDIRLLAGINKFGLDNWISVAKFVGNGRSRAQCAQRWVRGLDPRISKDQWLAEDEEKMLNLMKTSSNKGWTTIAAGMGNRSDVQCRYHFLQMQRDGKLKGEFANIMPFQQEKNHSPPIPLPNKAASRAKIARQASNQFPQVPLQLNAMARVQRPRSNSMLAKFTPSMQQTCPPSGQFQQPFQTMMQGQQQQLQQNNMYNMAPLGMFSQSFNNQNYQHPSIPLPQKTQRRSSMSDPKLINIFDEFSAEDDTLDVDELFQYRDDEDIFGDIHEEATIPQSQSQPQEQLQLQIPTPQVQPNQSYQQMDYSLFQNNNLNNGFPQHNQSPKPPAPPPPNSQPISPSFMNLNDSLVNWFDDKNDFNFQLP